MITGGFHRHNCSASRSASGFFLLPLSIIAGMAAGGIYASIVAVLNMKFNSSIVICTPMLNYVANYIASYLVSYPFKGPVRRRPVTDDPDDPGEYPFLTVQFLKHTEFRDCDRSHRCSSVLFHGAENGLRL